MQNIAAKLVKHFWSIGEQLLPKFFKFLGWRCNDVAQNINQAIKRCVAFSYFKFIGLVILLSFLTWQRGKRLSLGCALHVVERDMKMSEIRYLNYVTRKLAI